MIHFTKITSSKPLAKTYALAGDELTKITAAELYDGTYERVTVNNLTEFAQVSETLDTTQVLTYGVPELDTGRIVTKKKLKDAPGAIARTKEHFSWPPGGGVLLLDYDAHGQPLTRDELLAALFEVLPEGVGYVWWPSSSSHVFNTESCEDLTGLRGQRVYIAVHDATDIERAGKALAARLWLAGHGHFEISKSGALLDRTIIDATVWQANRIDFAAGSHCIAPLEQRRGAPLVCDGDALDTKHALSDLTKAEADALAKLKKAAADELKPQAESVQAAWIDDRVIELCETNPDLSSEKARIVAQRAVKDRVLFADFQIQLDGGHIKTVGDLLADPEKWHGANTLDPLEPDYLGGKVVGKLFLLGGTPRLYSFAHGGQSFRLMRQPTDLEIVGGNEHDAVQAVLRILRTMPDVGDFGSVLATINQSRVMQLENVDLLRHWLGGMVQFFVTKKGRNDVPYRQNIDPPATLCKSIIALGRGRELKPMDGVITAPVMALDGDILQRAGYHEPTRLYLDCDDVQAIPEHCTEGMARTTVAELMRPFNDFPWCSVLDKTVMLTALLSAVQRPVIPTCPAIGFDAPVQGSGKTLLAQCVGALATGRAPTIWPHVAGRDDEETRKRLFSALLSGDSAMIWDNILGNFDSASIAAFLTSPTFTDRILGASKSATVPNRIMFLMTGNNLRLAGDMPRRVLVCRIDPQTATPFARSFALDPLQYVLNHRQDLVRNALIILRAYQQDGDGVRADGRMASFEDWDDVVRQSVAWLSRIMPGQWNDPMDAIRQSVEADPEAEVLGEVLTALQSTFESNPFLAKEVHTRMNSGSYGGEDLREAFDGLIGRELSAKSLGRVLQNRKGRIVNGLVLRELPKDTVANAHRFKIEAA